MPLFQTPVNAATASAVAVGGITGLGTGVATALAINVGSAGAPVTNGGALGSPSSAGTLPAFTLGGTVAGGGNQINNVIIGTSTPLAGSFTTVGATGLITPAETVGIKGTVNANDAQAGSVGEYFASLFTSTALSTGVFTDVGTVTVGAGDWDLAATLQFDGASGTSQTTAVIFIGTAAGNNATGAVVGTNYLQSSGYTLITGQTVLTLPRVRKQPTGSTTYYLKAYAVFTVSTLSVSGSLTARRPR